MQLQTTEIEDSPLNSFSDLSLNHNGNGNGSGAANEHGHGLPTPPSSEDDRPDPDPTSTTTASGLDLRHIFAVGDCAETGAIQAGHTAYWQAEVAARNLCRLIDRQEGWGKESLESYKPGPPCIKLTLGLVS
jgi:hypothetical protein